MSNLHLLKLILSCCLAFNMYAAVAQGSGADSETIVTRGAEEYQELEKFTTMWFGLLDKQEYKKSWEYLSPAVLPYTPIGNWEAMMNVKRLPFGDVKTRKIKEIRRAKKHSFRFQDVDFYIFYTTVFKNGVRTQEQLTLEYLKDGSLAISGYYINKANKNTGLKYRAVGSSSE